MREWTRKIIEADRNILWWGKPSEMSPDVKQEFIRRCDEVDAEFDEGLQMSSFAKRWGKLTVEEVIELNKKAKETCEGDA